MSLITSYSSSCQPRIDSSIKTCPILEFLRPSVEISINSPKSYAVPPPSPPKVNAGRINKGHEPIVSEAAITSSIELQAIASLIGSPIDSQTLLNKSLSSALSIASKSEPINSTPILSNDPSCASSLAMFSAVCPPIPARIASGFSFSRIFLTVSANKGSM